MGDTNLDQKEMGTAQHHLETPFVAELSLPRQLWGTRSCLTDKPSAPTKRMELDISCKCFGTSETRTEAWCFVNSPSIPALWSSHTAHDSHKSGRTPSC